MKPLKITEKNTTARLLVKQDTSARNINWIFTDS